MSDSRFPDAELVVSDLDGTLLRSDGSVSQNTFETLSEVHSRGIRVLLATARPAASAGRMLQFLPFVDTIICSNGAAILDTRSRRVSRLRTIEPDDARAIIDYIRSNFQSASVAIDGPAWRVVDPTWPAIQMSVPGQATLWRMTRETVPVVQTICIMVLNAWADLNDVPADWKVAITSSSSGLIEFSSPSATKLAALRSYCKAINVPLANVVAFGDMPNDLDVLNGVGTGVAVANAHPDVRRAVRFHTDSNNDDGVAKFLRDAVLTTR